MLSLLLTTWVAGQGQALEMSFPAEPGLTAVSVRWSGHEVPFVRSGDRWLTIVGVDLDSRPGDHAVDVTFAYEDGHTRVVSEPVMVNAGQYPTTELQVEERLPAERLIRPLREPRRHRQGLARRFMHRRERAVDSTKRVGLGVHALVEPLAPEHERLVQELEDQLHQLDVVVDEQDLALAALQGIGRDAVVLHELVQGLAGDAAEPAARHAEPLELAVVEAADDGLLGDLTDLRGFAGREHGLHAFVHPFTGAGPGRTSAVSRPSAGRRL